MDRKNPASKVCIDPNLSMHGAVTPPPYYVCNECYREIPKKYQTYCHNIVQPVEDVSLYCENRVSFDAKACCFNLSLIVNQFNILNFYLELQIDGQNGLFRMLFIVVYIKQPEQAYFAL